MVANDVADVVAVLNVVAVEDVSCVGGAVTNVTKNAIAVDVVIGSFVVGAAVVDVGVNAEVDSCAADLDVDDIEAEIGSLGVVSVDVAIGIAINVVDVSCVSVTNVVIDGNDSCVEVDDFVRVVVDDEMLIQRVLTMNIRIVVASFLHEPAKFNETTTTRI